MQRMDKVSMSIHEWYLIHLPTHIIVMTHSTDTFSENFPVLLLLIAY